MPWSMKTPVIAAIVLGFCLVPPLWAEYSLETEWDPYYSNIGYYQSFNDEYIPEVMEDDEASLYSRMVDSAFVLPKFLVVELGAYPVPYLGAWLKERQGGLYDDLHVGGLNLVQAVTAGYNEPYALSFFLGSVVRFVRKGEETRVHNRGYTGFLFSFGDQHLVRNEIVNDKWYEFEWKIKGDQDFDRKTLSWSFRVGGKVHENADILDVIHFGLRRNHLDTASDQVSWFQNADMDLKIELSRHNFQLSQLSLFVNKKWPAYFSRKSTFEFGVGFIYEKNRYTGVLSPLANDFQVILRPALSF